MEETLKKIPLRQHLYIVSYMTWLCLRAFPFQIAMIGALNLIASLSPVASIWIGKLIIDETVVLISNYSQTGLHHLIFLVCCELGLVFSQSVLSQVTSYFNNLFTTAFELKMKETILEKCENIPYHQFESPRFHNYFQMMIDDISIGSSTYISALIRLSQSMIKLLSLSYILMLIDYRFILVIIGLNVADFYIGTKVTQRNYTKEYNLSESERRSDYFFELLTDIRHLKDIRLYNLGPFFKKRYTELRKHLTKQRLRMGLFQEWVFSALQLVSTIVYYGFYLYILFRVIKKKLTLGDISLYQRSYSTLSSSIAIIINTTETIYSQNLTFNLFFEFETMLEDESEKKKITSIELINIKSLCFGYPGTEKKALNNVSLELKPGQFNMLVGRNGCGKSTLIKLITRLYESSNTIFINDEALEQFDKNSYRARCSVLLQDFNKYALTLKENILLNKETDLSYDSLIQQTDLASIIQALPLQDQTMLSRIFENGSELSMGQWQKVAVARLLMRDADVIILDEPSSSLDHEYTQLLISLLKKICYQKNKIMLIVTHDKELLSQADTIFYMEQGVMKAQGTHQQLLNANENYYQLWQEINIKIPV